MNLTLYKTQDAQNVIGKTLTDSETLTINLKKDTDIVNPVLFLAPVANLDYFDFNYCAISELGRKYFIVDVEAVGPLFRLSLSCDVLETYKSGILASHCRYYRKIKSGDYQSGVIERSALSTISKHVSNVDLIKTPSMVMVTLRGDENE